ncbi:MAG: LAGLIDADG family homing endonuclease [Candidatus Pacearchaeota archaeon]
MRFADETTLAYIAGFLDGDGSIFFQIVSRPDYKQKFQIRSSVAFYQKTEYKEILEWLKNIFENGCIRHRKTGISDYTIVEPKEVHKILILLQPYIKLKKRQVKLGLEILNKLDNKKSDEDFLDICKLVDKFKELNYSKKRKLTYEVVNKSLSP